MYDKKLPYSSFDRFVLRTPLYPFSLYKNLTSKKDIQDEDFKNLLKKNIVKEAIFLASPTLYFELEKWLSGKLEKKKVKRVKLSLLKYLTRMSTRCTPFGLFAGCSVGRFSERTDLQISDPENHKRFTRPDMNYLVALSQDLAQKEHIKNQLLYFPNTSLYLVGEQLRFIEYFYIDSRRQHHIVEIDNSSYLQKVLQKASKGALLGELANELISDTISLEEAYGFLQELLESQVLTSNLEPSVSGPPFLDQMVAVLKPLKDCEEEIKFLEELSDRFSQLDLKIGNQPEEYLQISNFLKKQPTTFELKYLFQTDMEPNTLNCTLSKENLTELKKALVLFNRLTPPISENNMSRFKDAFQERYEEREMPLCHVLDVETGIGYLQNSGSGDVNPLVDDLLLPLAENPYANNEMKLNRIHTLLLEKLSWANDNNKSTIQLKEYNFQDFPVNWDDLPDTISSMIELIREKGRTKILVSGFGGSSAANLLGRFCHENSDLTSLTKSIIEKEDEMAFDKILAEIVHLPEARVGNILMRPNFRAFEIPYLAKSILDDNDRLELGDLYISVKRNRIRLRSKKYNKEVLPHLTNAHNYSANALPIYQFLCDLQTQNLRGTIGFNFGPLEAMFDFLPRVEYGNLILKEAQWRIQKKSIEALVKARNNEKILLKETQSFKKEKRLPKYVLLADGDNELLVNLENITSILMLVETVKNRNEFILKEFLYDEEGFAHSNGQYFTNQIVVCYYNQNRVKQVTDNKGKVYGKT